jgi:tight adherence protein C
VRLRQLRAGIQLLIVILIWAILRLLTHPGTSVIPAIVLLLSAVPVGGWAVRERLGREATRRGVVMNLQLPTILDLLAFAVSAGESTTAALRRVAQTVPGPLGMELDRAMVDVSHGVPLAHSLKSVAQASRSTGVERAVRAIEVAIERGTPLAEVLRAQAADARNEQMRLLLTVAGHKETAMMLPVVFLVLPMIVVVAILPATVSMHMF